jgi:hypothetical protein
MFSEILTDYTDYNVAVNRRYYVTEQISFTKHASSGERNRSLPKMAVELFWASANYRECSLLPQNM